MNRNDVQQMKTPNADFCESIRKAKQKIIKILGSDKFPNNHRKEQQTYNTLTEI